MEQVTIDAKALQTIERLSSENARLREIIREQAEFIQSMKRNIRDFLAHPSLGGG